MKTIKPTERYSLCADLNESPIYKVINYEARSRKQMYVFVGKQDGGIMKAIQSKKRTKSQEEELEKRFGKNYKNKLGFYFKDEPIYIQETIYHDDTVQTMLSKLKHYLEKINVPVNQIYAWIEITANNVSFVSNYFLNTLYTDLSLVSIKAVADNFFAYTGKRISYTNPDKLLNKQEAHKLLSKQKFRSILEPLLLKYAENGAFKYFPVDPFKAEDQIIDPSSKYDQIYEHGRLLESFSIINNTIYTITSKAYDSIFGTERKDIYFPNVGALKEIPIETVTSADEIMNLYHQKILSKNFSANCHFNYIHLRVNEFLSIEEEVYSVHELFTKFRPNGKIPFIKYISSTNTEYKVYKHALTTDIVDRDIGSAQISFEQLSEWTKIDLIRFVKVMHDIIVIKIHLVNNLYATVIIHGNGMYDVKLNYSVTNKISFKRLKDNDEIPDVTSHLKEINKVLPFVINPRQFVPIDTATWVKDIDDSDTRIVKLMTSGVITSTGKLQTVLNLEKNVKNIFPFVSVVGTKGGILHMLYKRIDNFSKHDNMMIFISKNFILPDEDLVIKLIENFGVNAQEAREQLLDWKKKNNISSKLGGKLYFKQTINDFVSIKLKPSGVGYKYIVSGTSSILHHRRIIRVIKYLVSITESGRASSAKSKVIDDVSIIDDIVDIDNLEDDDNNDNFDNDITDIADTDAMDQTEKNFQKFMEDYGVDDVNEAGMRLLEMKENMSCPEVKTGGAKKKEEKSHMYILKQLYEADHDLFFFQSAENYAKSCQESQKRQPVVLKKKEIEYIKKCFPGAVENHVNTGSTPGLASENHYVCPVVWCPKSRVALSRKQFNEEYGGKCPFEGIDEEPMLFEDKYFIDKNSGKPKKRFARFLHPSKHPDSTESKPLQLPCCFSRPDSEDKGNEKYIKAYTYPLSKNRYGLLPASLAKIFKNKFCGGKNGTTGLMTSKTDCYLRSGVNLSKHSYLTSLIDLLDNPMLTDEQSIIDVIINKLKVSTFVLLDKGLLCKKFINDSWSITNVALFSQFKNWFIQQNEYVVTFNLQDVANEVNQSVVYGDHLVYKSEIKREFLIYSAYTSFLKYLVNDNIPKSHEILNTLVNMKLSWLNKHGYNVIVFETEAIKKTRKKEDDGKKQKQNRLKQMKNQITQDDEDGEFAFLGLEHVYLTCPYSADLKDRFRKEKSTVMLIKSGKYYEPIVHAAMKKNKMTQTSHHKYTDTPEVSRVIDYYLGFCTASGQGRALDILNAIESSGTKVVTQVIDYDYNLVAFYSDNQILVPLNQPDNYLVNSIATFAFVDTAIQHLKFEKKSDKVIKYLLKLNQILGETYFDISNESDQFKLKLMNNSLNIPIGDSLTQLYKDDLKIFINEQEKDERITSNSKQVHELNVYNAFRNEIVHMMSYDNHLLQDVQFLRHPSNPLSLNQKRTYLLSKLQENNKIKRFAHEVSDQTYNRTTDHFQERVCSTIGKQKECINQCVWTVDIRTEKKKKNSKIINSKTPMKMVASHCKLAVRQGGTLNLLEKVVDDLLNPTSVLKLVKENKEVDVDDDLLRFTDREIENGDLVKMLMQMESPRIYDHQYETLPIDHQKLASFEKSTNKKDDETVVTLTDLPHVYRKQFKKFQVREIEYDRDFLYQLFSKIASRINTQLELKPNQLKRLVQERCLANLESNQKEVKTQLQYNLYFKNKSSSDLSTALSSSDYYPSEYEIKMISEIIKVNIVVMSSRVSSRHEQLRCVGKVPGADYYVILYQPSSSKKTFDMFHIIIKDNKDIFQLEDFEESSGLISNLCKMHTFKKKI